eukprot:PhM_4_TR919/c0_g1_i1/m.84292
MSTSLPPIIHKPHVSHRSVERSRLADKPTEVDTFGVHTRPSVSVLGTKYAHCPGREFHALLDRKVPMYSSFSPDGAFHPLGAGLHSRIHEAKRRATKLLQDTTGGRRFSSKRTNALPRLSSMSNDNNHNSNKIMNINSSPGEGGNAVGVRGSRPALPWVPSRVLQCTTVRGPPTREKTDTMHMLDEVNAEPIVFDAERDEYATSLGSPIAMMDASRLSAMGSMYGRMSAASVVSTNYSRLSAYPEMLHVPSSPSPVQPGPSLHPGQGKLVVVRVGTSFDDEI